VVIQSSSPARGARAPDQKRLLDELEFTPEFERIIQESERDMAKAKTACVREPEGS
jgi:hypothetical protein